MAKCKIVGEPRYQLTLSFEELMVLTTILGRVGGCPQHSPRKFAAAINKEIEDITGIDPYRDGIDIRETSLFDATFGTLMFNDNTLDTFLEMIEKHKCLTPFFRDDRKA